MGAVEDGLTWASLKATVQDYLELDDDVFAADETLLEAMFDAAKRQADEYLNNPFEELKPQITLNGVVADDWVTINGATFTAKATKDEDERYFAVGGNDSLTADNLCELINSTTLGGSYGAVGVEGVLAANSNGVITLTRRYPNVDDITVTSSDEDKLLVRQIRTAQAIPDAVSLWIYMFMYRLYENRQALIQEAPQGEGLAMWLSMKSEEAGMITNYDLLRSYRLIPGL